MTSQDPVQLEFFIALWENQECSSLNFYFVAVMSYGCSNLGRYLYHVGKHLL